MAWKYFALGAVLLMGCGQTVHESEGTREAAEVASPQPDSGPQSKNDALSAPLLSTWWSTNSPNWNPKF